MVDPRLLPGGPLSFDLLPSLSLEEDSFLPSLLSVDDGSGDSFLVSLSLPGGPDEDSFLPSDGLDDSFTFSSLSLDDG